MTVLKLKKIVLACVILAWNFTGVAFSQQRLPSPFHINDPIEVAQAEIWLYSIDLELYGQSWDEASFYFQSKITKEQWITQVASVRKPLGGLISRTLKENKKFSSLPGAPDGEYCVMSFETVLENKASAIETVTMLKDEDGQWRVAGYFIR